MKLFIAVLSTFGLLVVGCYGGEDRMESVDFGHAPADDSSPPAFDAVPPSDPDDGALDHGSTTDAVPLPADGIPVDAGMVVPDPVPLPNIYVNLAWGDRTIMWVDLPITTTVVKKQNDFVSAQVEFYAPPDSAVHFSEVTFEGRGNISHAWRAENLRDVVWGCGLYDGATQLGSTYSPDDAGVIRILDARFSLAAGTAKILTIRCSADSVVALPEGDRFAIGLGVTVPTFVAVDDLGRERLPQFGRLLFNQVDPTVEPALPIIVQNSGTLSIVMDYEHLRPATILVPDGSAWQQMATYNAEAIFEDGTIEFVRIHSQGDAANFTEVGIAQEGYVRGTCILPAGRDQACDARLTDPITVAAGEQATFYLWARLASIVSGASVAGATEGVARSGATIALGLSDSIETGEWDSSYRHMVNVRATGSISGERLYWPSTTPFGNTFVVRKSYPTVTRQELATTTIVNGAQQDLYKFQVSANAAGSVAVVRMGMTMDIRSAVGRVCNPRLFRGSVELSPVTDYSIGGVAIVDGQMCWVTGSQPLNIHFFNEVVAGSGNAYTISGTSSGFVAGDSIVVGFSRLGDDRVSTGYLAAVWSSTSSDVTLDGSPFGAPDSTGSRIPASLIWSDMSEVPHSPAMGAGGGSRDWTNGYLIEDLTRPQVLTAP